MNNSQLSTHNSPLIPPGYKQTEAGVIPEDWVVTPLESVTPPNGKNGIVDGPFGSNLKTIHYRTSGIPIITSGYVTDGKFRADKYLYVDRAKFLEEKRSSVQPGDIVMAKIGERCGASAILPEAHETGILSGNALKITVDPLRHSTFYVWQVLWNLHSSGDMELLRTVGAQPAISMANLKKHKISLPPTKAEQEAVAEALSDADALIESLEQLLAKKRLLKQGAMQELLTGKKRLPGFSGEWEVNRLGEVSEIVMGQSPSSAHYNDKGEGLPLIQGNADISSRQTIRRVFTTEVTKWGYPGDILISVRAPVGEISRTGFDVCLGRGVCAIRCPENDFLYYALIAREQAWAKLSKGSTFDSVSSTDVEQFEIEQPTDETEQHAIAAILSDMDAEIAALETKLSKARQIKQGMMQELLTGRIRLI